MRIGIAGCGLVGTKRALALGRGKVSVVGDVVPSRAKAVAKLTGARPVGGWEEVVASPETDGVIAAVTPDLQPAVARACLKAGKPVFLEKPGARKASDLEGLLAPCRRQGTPVWVGYNHRYHPALRKARALVDDGALGRLLHIRGRYGHGGRPGYEKEWRARARVSGGGELMDQGSHLLDLSRWFLGEFREARAWTPTLFWDMPVEDNAFVYLRTKSGAVAWLHAGWTEWKNIFSFEIAGERGKLHVEGLGGSYGTERLTHYQMSPRLGPPKEFRWSFPGPDESWGLELADFLKAARTGKEPDRSLKEACATLRLVDRLCRR